MEQEQLEQENFDQGNFEEDGEIQESSPLFVPEPIIEVNKVSFFNLTIFKWLIFVGFKFNS